MPILRHQPPPPTPLQQFRVLTEELLMQVAQEEMLRQYPGTGRPPARKSGLIYSLLRLFFLPGFRLTPWPVRHRLMGLFFVHAPQQWLTPSQKKGEKS